MYARTVGGEELTFGVSGMLWRDNLVMYDRQTESWWAQAEGRAIHGPKRGTRLEQVQTARTPTASCVCSTNARRWRWSWSRRAAWRAPDDARADALAAY